MKGNATILSERRPTVATGPSGVGPGGGHIPLSAEWLKKAADAAKKQATGKTEAEEASESLKLSDAAKGLAVTKDEKMLQTMKAELSQLNPESETFMEEATEKLIDSVIEQEYGESFKKKSGYEGLQDKLLSTILSNETTREAVADFFELLLMIEEGEEGDEDEDEFEDDEDEGESEEDDDQGVEDESSYEEE
jgi:hypothetical protein